MKIKVGSLELETDLRPFAAAREGRRAEPLMMTDADQRWGLAEAIEAGAPAPHILPPLSPRDGRGPPGDDPSLRRAITLENGHCRTPQATGSSTRLSPAALRQFPKGAVEQVEKQLEVA